MQPLYHQLWLARDAIVGYLSTLWAAVFAWISTRLL